MFKRFSIAACRIKGVDKSEKVSTSLKDDTKKDSLNRELFFSPRSREIEKKPAKDQINLGKEPEENAPEIAFEDLFNLEDIQRLQDEFARATGVASMIMRPDGVPITKPSNFCRLCFDLIRKTEKGFKNCVDSDATFGRPNAEGPTIALCRGVGLWDAGATIMVEGRHLANWMIGQVRDDCQTEEQIRAYAREIEADEQEMVEAFYEVPAMSQEQFRYIAEVLYTLANQLSAVAFHNVQRARIIAERQRVEDALRESERKFRSVFNNTFELMGILTPDGIVTAANRTALEFENTDESEELGKPFWDTIWWKSVPEVQEWLHEAIGKAAAGEFVRNEIQLTASNGKPAVIDFSLKPVRNEEGKVVFLIPEGRDITDLKKAEFEKAKLKEQLRQSQKMEAVGRLAGGIAHDFNNLLTGIIGYTQTIQSMLDTNDPIYIDLEEIRKAADRAAGLTNQLLAFSRKQIINPRVILLNDVIQNSQKMIARIIGEDIRLTFKPQNELWRVKADPNQVDQILVNLAVNARDAMPDGGSLNIETQNVTIDSSYGRSDESSKPGDFVMLAVTDSGKGISPETLPHIFEPFFSTKSKEKGTGLGLSTVYGIMKQNNGSINVYSELNVGTTFKAYFPAVMEEAETIVSQIDSNLPNGTETILLVEDEDMVRRLAKRILTSHGYKVLDYDSGGNAYIFCDKNDERIDLLLTDVVMPGLNGMELLTKLKEKRPALKALFMSGYTENVIVHRGVLEKKTNFLQKPFTHQALTKKVREALDR